ncbi:galactosylgalactosylxylosylprotein 3-beta-glucuronosyltransferase 1-like [Pleurodeles waltl]|uniref:galactosylgalactosylxylosylprotein 3-beta-glucuronosyltransferase 1-like n=1 Tax=Pleurodeles waltl TaxID=8319 RepID=UPI0037093A32
MLFTVTPNIKISLLVIFALRFAMSSLLRQLHLVITGCTLLSTVLFLLRLRMPPLQKCLDTAHHESAPLQTIFAITPTYARLVQKAELTRLAHTFLHLKGFHWIVIEDAYNKTQLVTLFLKNCGIQYTHLWAKSEKGEHINKGARQRNKGLSWLREQFTLNETIKGVVYFADDDNVYSLQLFEEMRHTQKVSVWPVAFAGGLRYESVDVDTFGKVKGWKVKYDLQRAFAIDMAGFAVNLNLIIKKHNAWFPEQGYSGKMESRFLEGLAVMEDLEPKASNCTKILVWHTRTQGPNVQLDNGYTDLNVEV